MAKKDELNDQQKLFCEYYIVSMNATQAALNAGYSDGTNYFSAAAQASRLLKNVKIRKHISQLLELKKDEIDITRAEVINGIKTIANDPNISASVRLNALSKLGDYLKMFEKEPQVVVNNISNNVKEMTDEELEKELKRLEGIDDDE